MFYAIKNNVKTKSVIKTNYTPNQKQTNINKQGITEIDHSRLQTVIHIQD